MNRSLEKMWIWCDNNYEYFVNEKNTVIKKYKGTVLLELLNKYESIVELLLDGKNIEKNKEELISLFPATSRHLIEEVINNNIEAKKNIDSKLENNKETYKKVIDFTTLITTMNQLRFVKACIDASNNIVSSYYEEELNSKNASFKKLPLNKKIALIYYYDQCFNIPTSEITFLYNINNEYKLLKQLTEKETIKYEYIDTVKAYEITSFQDFVSVLYENTISKNIIIRKCINCGIYFITEEKWSEYERKQRKDVVYCIACKRQNASMKLYRQRLYSNGIKHEVSNFKSFIRTRKNRATSQNEVKKYERITKQFNDMLNKKNIKEEEIIKWIREKRGEINGNARTRKE